LPFDPLVANNAARLLCLSPGAVTNYESLVALAERALTEARDEQQRMLHLNTLGIILYGAGRYREAIHRLNKRVKADAAAGAPVDWAFLAMALIASATGRKPIAGGKSSGPTRPRTSGPQTTSGGTTWKSFSLPVRWECFCARK
jgi:hypothetical protein